MADKPTPLRPDNRRVEFLTPDWLRDLQREMERRSGRITVTESLSPCLLARVSGTGVTWLVRASFQGTQRPVTVGRWPDMSIEAARAKADEVRTDTRKGINPARHGMQQTDMTLGAQIIAWVAANRAKAKAYRRWARAIKRRCANLLDTHVAAITRTDLQDCIDATVDAGHPAAAIELSKVLRGLFEWMTAEYEALIVKGHLRLRAPEPNKRDRVPTIAECRIIWDASERLPQHLRGLMRVLMVTAQRRTELSLITRADLDGESQTFTVRAANNKTGTALITPAPDLAWAEIEECIGVRQSMRALVFAKPDGHPLNNNDFTALIAWINSLPGITHRITLHDFRRGLMNHMLMDGWAREVLDRQINHSASSTISTVDAAYVKTDLIGKRREMLAAWEAKMSSPKLVPRGAGAPKVPETIEP